MKILLLIFLTMPLYMIGQNKIKYSYDDAGNRIKREIVLSSLKSAISSDQITSFIEEVADQKIIIYPNPTKGQLTIEITDPENTVTGNLTIFNLRGQVIAKEQISSTRTSIDISTEPRGAYILHININEETSAWKIIKE
uniref:T9SS type A sorting domain-containing protein n=1 Tax=uncultured Dysgonomonas sp. TaxID=206096 RepID=UPI0026107CFB|nr:T9SS type A sorting domain-containing protein [uncultured Dysgonomonas sp.]